MFGWSQGLKTGSYYIRSKPSMNSQSFTIDPNKAKKFARQKQQQEEQECLSCGS